MHKNPEIWTSEQQQPVPDSKEGPGAEMLEVGVRMIYSACSFHPLENEAVVSRLLQDMQGRLEVGVGGCACERDVARTGFLSWS